MAGTDLEEELQYSRALIDSNFSNYSAWHNRASTLKAQQSMDQVISLEDLVAGKQAGPIFFAESCSEMKILKLSAILQGTAQLWQCLGQHCSRAWSQLHP